MTSGASDDYEELNAAYSMESHAKFITPARRTDECVIDYEPLKLSSFRVCLIHKGTILESRVLLVEQLCIVAIFFLCAWPVYLWFKDDVSEGEGKLGQISVRRFVMEQEEKMRAFAMIMTGLAAFLMSFYTSIIVTRWWTIRTGGIGGLKAATVDLELLLYQCVTKDEQVLSAVRRYGRLSVLLVFLWRRKELGDKQHVREILEGNVQGQGLSTKVGEKEWFSELAKEGLLSSHECDQFIKLIEKFDGKINLHESIWAWQAAVVNKLYSEDKIESDQLYSLLLDCIMRGRAAAQLIHTHLAVRVPMQYVHLLGLLVKMHNIVLSIICGILFGAALRGREYIVCVQLFARIFILPFLFNAILCMNCDLADPCDGTGTDPPGEVFEANLQKDCIAMVGATDNVPHWLSPSEDRAP